MRSFLRGPNASLGSRFAAGRPGMIRGCGDTAGIEPMLPSAKTERLYRVIGPMIAG